MNEDIWPALVRSVAFDEMINNAESRTPGAAKGLWQDTKNFLHEATNRRWEGAVDSRCCTQFIQSWSSPCFSEELSVFSIARVCVLGLCRLVNVEGCPCLLGLNPHRYFGHWSNYIGLPLSTDNRRWRIQMQSRPCRISSYSKRLREAIQNSSIKTNCVEVYRIIKYPEQRSKRPGTLARCVGCGQVGW